MMKESQARKKATVKAAQAVAMIVAAHLLSTAGAGAQTAPKTSTANGKVTARRDVTARPASTGGGSCDIGVVIATGDEFTVKSTGLTIFQNKTTAVPIPGWRLGDLMFARIRAAIPAGVSVLRIPYFPAKIPSHDSSKDTLMDRLFRDLKAELADYMREVVKGTSCRHYIQIGNSISPIGSSNYTVRGFGIINQDVLVGHRIYLYALAFIRVFDGRDFSVIRQSSALINLQPLMVQRLLGAQIGGPYRELPEASFPARPEDAAGNSALRDDVRAMLAESLDKTLPFMLGVRPTTRQSDTKER